MTPGQRAELLGTATRLAERAAETADRTTRHGGSLDEREQARLDAATAQAMAAIVSADLLADAVSPGGHDESISINVSNWGG